MDTILDKYKSKPLSNIDIEQILDGKTNIILYPDLYKYQSLDEILDPYEACIILYQTKKDFCHWCCITKRNNNLIEFFDPYGTFVDDQLKFIPENFRKQSKQDYPHLTWLLYNSPYQISYNEIRFQKLNQSIQTCGRWCVFRIICKDMDLYDFQKMIKQLTKKLNLTNDELITLVTYWKV